MLQIVRYPATSHGSQPKALAGLWSLCHLSWVNLLVSPPTTPITQTLASPGFCASKCGVLPSASLFIVLSSQGLSSLTQTRPTSPLFTGRDPLQTSAHLGVSVPLSGLPWASLTPCLLNGVLPQSKDWVSVLLVPLDFFAGSPDVGRQLKGGNCEAIPGRTLHGRLIKGEFLKIF